MGGFKRAFLGYRRDEVDAAIGACEGRIEALEREVADAVENWRLASEAATHAEQESAELSAMVIERERQVRSLAERLQEANERHERSIASLEPVAARLEEINRQARGQATRIRMKALREAAEVSRQTREMANGNGAATGETAEDAAPAGEPNGLYEGLLKLEIGPLGDFSQLVEIEEAISRMGAAEISVERFSEGRATLSMRLDEPVELLRELEERAPLDFRIRRTAEDNVVLDVDEDEGSEQQAA